MKHCAHKNRLDYAAVTKIAFTSQGHKTQRFVSHITYPSLVTLTPHPLAGTSHMTAATQGGPRKNNSA